MKAVASSHVRAIALVVASTMFMAQLDGAVLATALPQMASDFSVPPVRLSVSISAYLIAFVALLPATGWIAERFGTRNIFILAIGIFSFTSLLCAMSKSYWPFILARVVQGAGASLMTPVGRLVLLRSTPKSELLRAMSIATMPMLLAPTFGPPLGGFIVTYFSWPYIFLLNLPVAVPAMFVAWRLIPNLRSEVQRQLDLRGWLLVSGSLLTLLTGIDQLSVPDSSWTAIMLLIPGIYASVVAVRHLRSHRRPILSLAPLGCATFRIATIAGGAFARLPLRALLFLLPLMFQVEFGMTPFAAGAMLFAFNAGDLAFKPISRHGFKRFGFRTMLVVSGLTGAVTIFACATFQPVNTAIATMCIVLAIGGLARSMLFTGITTLAFSELEESNITSANILVNMTQQVINTFSISLSVLLLHLGAWAHGAGAAIGLDDYRFTLMTMAAIGLCAAIALLQLSPRAGMEVSGHVRT
ncbi:MAG: MFS transporter [Steroidobacteraceae bacterium]